jgi:GR25 family glycosyltransferase involved in LPS biosynthesis
LFLFILLFGLLSTQAAAASFDCKKAATWLEKTVCSNPELSKLDGELAKAYQDALASLSPEGQDETKQYQRQWLKKISLLYKPERRFRAPAEVILHNSYEERIEQLQHSLIRFPDRVFRNVHVSHEKTDKSCEDAYLGRYLMYPQIENPRDENEKFWNSFISKKANDHLKAFFKCQDIDDEYAVTFSNKHLISVKFTRNWYTQGTAHGYLATESIAWLLEERRELQASDLFDDKTDWQNKLEELVGEKLKLDWWNDPELTHMITSPSLWEVSKDGLGYLSFFNAAGYGNAPVIIIDWKTLDPYLSKNGHSLIYD